jgi:enoyl-CoA hydratase
MRAMQPLVTLDIADSIATVTLTRPTMPPAFFTELEGAFRGLAASEGVRAVLLRSSAKAWSYGLDLAAAMKDLGPQLAGGGTAGPRMELHALIRRLQGAIDAVAACPAPVIAAIHGWCIGGGLDLAAACDIRLASADARFSLRETKIAIVADLGSLQRLPGIIGQGRTRELAFTGKDVTAARAEAMGLVNEVFPDEEALLAGARVMAAEIAANPPLTVRGVKQVLAFGEGKTVAEGLSYVAAWNAAFLASEDLGEALAAFAERRAPSYKGR